MFFRAAAKISRLAGEFEVDLIPWETYKYKEEVLEKGDVALMLKEKDFFDKTLNESGKGLQHDFQIIGHDDNRLIFDSTTGLT